MSSRSYYVPSPIELSRDRIAALEQQLDIVNRVKRALLAKMGTVAAGNTEARVQAASFGELAVQAAAEIDVEAIAEASDAANLGQAVEATGAVDFTERFWADAQREKEAAQSVREYLDDAKARASRLVALSSSERSEIRRFMGKCDDLATRGGTADDVRPFVEDELAQLCSQLGEEGSDHRMDLCLDYLSLCSVTGENPRDLTFAEMKAAIERMRDDMALRAFRQELSESFDDALEEVGLKSVKTITLEEERGRLVIDQDGGPCALFVSETAEGAFVFTTIAGKDPRSMTQDERFAARDSAMRLCTKKERLLNEALAERGIVAEVRYEYPPDLRFVERSDDFASYQQSSASGKRGEDGGTTVKARSAE